MNNISRKKLFVIFSVFVLVSSALIFNLQAGASLDQLQITSVPSFSGQMYSSYFARNGTLFAGDNNYNLYRSDNNGTSFRLIYQFPKQSNPNSMVTGYVWTIFVDSRNYLLVSIPGTNRLYRSTNYGSSFTQVLNTNGTQNDGFYIAITEDSRGQLYTVTYCSSIYPRNPTLLKSTNGGASWSVILEAAVEHFHNVKFNPSNGYLYTVTGEWAQGYNNQNCERVLRSKDFGQTWNIVIDRPQEIDAAGNTIYLPMLFDNNWVYLGTDQAFQPNWIDRFYDDGSNTAFNPETAYTFPSDSTFPVISGVWLNKIILFSNTAEFSGGTSRVVASEDGVNWQIIKSTTIPQSLHHTNMLTSNPNGIVFGSDGPGQTFAITEKATQPQPTPTPTPTPNPDFLFKADFETKSFSEYAGTGGAGTHSESVETSNPYLGAYNAKFTTGASSEGWAYQPISNTAITYYRQLIKLNSLPTSGNYLCLGSIQNANSQNTVDAFIYNSNGQYYWGIVSVVNGVFYWDRESTTSNPRTGTYYNVETCRDVTNHRTSLWIDGNLKVDVSRSHVGNSNLICTGITWAGSSATIYVDCVRVKSSYIGVEPGPQPTPTPTPTPTPAPLTTALQVSANVTVTDVSFNQSTALLYITLIKNGTNYIEAIISKKTLPSISTLKVYVNTAQKPFNYTSTGDFWKITLLTT